MVGALRKAWREPSAVITLMRMNSQIDVRHILDAIRVPTLVLHRQGDTRVNVEGGRYLAAHIAGARYVEFARIRSRPVGRRRGPDRRRDGGISHRRAK